MGEREHKDRPWATKQPATTDNLAGQLMALIGLKTDSPMWHSSTSGRFLVIGKDTTLQ